VPFEVGKYRRPRFDQPSIAFLQQGLDCEIAILKIPIGEVGAVVFDHLGTDQAIPHAHGGRLDFRDHQKGQQSRNFGWVDRRAQRQRSFASLALPITVQRPNPLRRDLPGLDED
jgi:hypothetical protein